MPAQTIKAPNGDEMVILPKAEYEALRAAAEEAEEDALDIAAYDAAKADLEGLEPLPFAVTQSLLKGTGLLEALRKWRGETQTGVARGTGLSQGYVSDLETGRRQLTAQAADLIARHLDIPRHWLWAGTQ